MSTDREPTCPLAREFLAQCHAEAHHRSESGVEVLVSAGVAESHRSESNRRPPDDDQQDTSPKSHHTNGLAAA